MVINRNTMPHKLEMFDELVETQQCTRPRVVLVGLEVVENLLGDGRPLGRVVVLYDVTDADGKLHPDIDTV